MQDGSNKRPLVSIIIPAYNAGKYITETIDSVIEQTYINWELIIVNDGSADNTLSIIENYSAKDKRIAFISKQNTGVSDTRNTGIERAKGEFIAFLDADDVWLPSNLEMKVRLLEENGSIDYVFSNMLQADQNLQNRTLAPVGKDANIFEDLLLWNGEVIPGPCSNLVIRKKCLDSGIRFDTSLTTIADQNFTVQLAEKHKGKLINEALWIYRIIPGSMSKSLTVMEKDSLTTYAIYKEKKYFRSNPFRKKCFVNMYLILSGSWFRDGHNFSKGSKYLLQAFVTAPIYTTGVLFRKLFKKKS
jgi:glycosyltransferase involved in cell wall biosynthesis